MIVRVCGTTPPTGHVTSSSDCCDSDNRVFPAQTAQFTTMTMCGGFDYDCNGHR